MQEALRHELSDIHELTTALEAAKSLGPQRPQPRSVLWMMADDLRADAASHFSRVLPGATVFTHAYPSATMCMPCHGQGLRRGHGKRQ